MTDNLFKEEIKNETDNLLAKLIKRDRRLKLVNPYEKVEISMDTE